MDTQGDEFTRRAYLKFFCKNLIPGPWNRKFIYFKGLGGFLIGIAVH